MKLISGHKLLMMSIVILGVQQSHAQNPYQNQLQQQAPQQTIQQQPQPVAPQATAPAQPSMPQIQSAQPAQQPVQQAAAANPANPCGDRPNCEITVNATDFYKYLAVCSRLGGASIKWKLNQYYGMTIRANPQGTCTLDVVIMDKAVNTCNYTDAQIAKMTTPEAMAQVKQYDANPDQQLLLVVMKPIFDCVGPMPNLQNLLPNVQNMMQKMAPAGQQPAHPAQPAPQPVQQTQPAPQ